MATFGGWLQTLLINNATVGYELSMLAKKPSTTILTFQGYEINGNTFYMIPQDKKSTNQNGGVRFDATNNSGTKDTYYWYIEEIWELDYGPSFKVPLFRCKWVKLTNTSHDEPKHHIVLSGKRIIMGVEDKTDMSEDYNKFDEILPFRVNTDPTERACLL
jgi:hypothetical protein